MTTEYEYDPNNDRLITETQCGASCALDINNERYYAYARPDGKGFYYRDTNGKEISHARAFFMGLPSAWSKYLLLLTIAMLPVMLFGPAAKRLITRLLFCHGKPTRLRVRVPKKGICLLVAFVMLLSPEGLDTLARAEAQYANLGTSSWGQANRTIHYSYDANGSLEKKIIALTGEPDPENNYIEKYVYTYNIANRLETSTCYSDEGNDHVKTVTVYTYNDEGIRVACDSEKYVDYYPAYSGYELVEERSTTYLVDSYNHTGYAQVLEEASEVITYPGPSTANHLTTYLIGDDVIAQSVDGVTQYLLYDGHGSTRQLVEYDSAVTIVDTYSYDGYGVLLQNESAASQRPGNASPQATSLLYAGEFFDTDVQQYYLRARWYDSLTGRFNRMDPFSGNINDPQSLHKYLYVHNNPVNSIDPSGLSFLSLTIQLAVMSSLMATIIPQVLRGYSAAKQILELTDLVNLVRRLANRGIIEFIVAESIRIEAFRTFTDLLGAIGNSMLLIAKEIALHYGYSMAFAAVTHVAMGGIKTSVRLTKMGLARLKFGNVFIDKHHLVFKCAVRSGVRQRLWYLPRSLHKGAGTGLHSRIASHQTFRNLQPRRGTKVEQVILDAGGPDKWLNKLGNCYKWLEMQDSNYKGIYEAYKKAVLDIGGVEGIIEVGT